MKHILIILFSIITLSAYAQPGSLSQSLIRLRVNDSTTVNGAHTSGYTDIYYNRQRKALLFWEHRSSTDSSYQEFASKSYVQDVVAALSGGGHVIEDEGTPLTARTKLNFVGAGVTVTDDSGDDASVVTIAAGAVSSVFSRTGAVVAATSDYDAVQVDNTPAGNIAATNVQAAIDELDTEKLSALLTLKTETASHTLDADDLSDVVAGKAVKIRMSVATANVLTLPLNSAQAFPIGTRIVIQWTGVGQTSIAITATGTINSPNGWLNIAYQFASVVATKVGTNEWDVEGTLMP